MESTNVLVAIKNLYNIKERVLSLGKGNSRNRINSVGESLEEFVKDLFCNSVNETEDKHIIHAKFFSYLGAKNSPPDIIIKGSDAVEVKKIESSNSSLALNSSYPKDVLYSDSALIQEDCRKCEEVSWDAKDFLYVVGVVKKNTLLSLWLVYGNCYAASKATYERVSNQISTGLRELPDIEFSETNELGRVNEVDPLKVTHLRVRGMWGIQNPNKVFEYLPLAKSENFSMNALILDHKYNSMPKIDRDNLEKIAGNELKVSDVKIKSPNNPAKLLDAKLITMEK